MSYQFHYWSGKILVSRPLPDAAAKVMEGVTWGNPWTLFTPAYWLSQYWMSGLGQEKESPFRAKGSLAQELVFCMLGGFGIRAELALAAFDECERRGLIAQSVESVEAWKDSLGAILYVDGKKCRYRYPNQKAKLIAGAMAYLRGNSMRFESGRDLRDQLLKIDGVGPKTAGWVARNYLDTDDVAILDVHLWRAGLLCGLFTPSQNIARDYFALESRFIEFCLALGTRPALLDCLIWDQMRTVGKLAPEMLARARAAAVVQSPETKKHKIERTRRASWR